MNQGAHGRPAQQQAEGSPGKETLTLPVEGMTVPTTGGLFWYDTLATKASEYPPL